MPTSAPAAARGGEGGPKRQPSLFRGLSWVAPPSRHAELRRFQSAWSWSLALGIVAAILHLSVLLVTMGYSDNAANPVIFFIQLLLLGLAVYFANQDGYADAQLVCVCFMVAAVIDLLTFGSTLGDRRKILYEVGLPHGCADAVTGDEYTILSTALSCNGIERRSLLALMLAAASCVTQVIAFVASCYTAHCFREWQDAGTKIEMPSRRTIAAREPVIPPSPDFSTYMAEDAAEVKSGFHRHHEQPAEEPRRQAPGKASGELNKYGNPVSPTVMARMEFAQGSGEGRTSKFFK